MMQFDFPENVPSIFKTNEQEYFKYMLVFFMKWIQNWQLSFKIEQHSEIYTFCC